MGKGKHIDLTGKHYGRLTVLSRTENKLGSSWIWNCICDPKYGGCGNDYTAPTNHLNAGTIISCGCQRKEKSVKNISGDIRGKIGLVYDTNISRLESDKLSRNNTSGHVGVSKKKNRYISYIYFQKKRYHLGSFKLKEDAIAARKEAEEKIHGKFLEWYHETYKTKENIANQAH